MTHETKPETNDAAAHPDERQSPPAPAPEPTRQFATKALLAGVLVGVLVGAALCAVVTMPMTANHAPFPGTGPHIKPAAKPPGDGGAGHFDEPMTPSYAQQGEDLVMLKMLMKHGIRHPTYVDVGAHEPVINSNTYWFYKLEGNGVLVEPNPVFAAKLRAARPRDTVLEVGVGTTDENEADYYVMNGDGQTNTFSKKQADILVNQHHQKVVKTIKRKLVKLNEILEQNFKQGSPHVLSVDAEGMDYDILKSVDWKRWRPMIICVETSDVATGKVERDILDLMQANGYTVRGGSFVNTIFLDDSADDPPSAAKTAK